MVEYKRSGHVKTLFLSLLIPANWINQAFYEQRQRSEHEIFVVNCIAYQNYKCLAGLWNGAWAQHIDKNQHIKHFNIFINHHQQFIKPPRSVKFSRPKETGMSQFFFLRNIKYRTKYEMRKFTLIVRSIFPVFILFLDSVSFAFHLIFLWTYFLWLNNTSIDDDYF